MNYIYKLFIFILLLFCVTCYLTSSIQCSSSFGCIEARNTRSQHTNIIRQAADTTPILDTNIAPLNLTSTAEVDAATLNATASVTNSTSGSCSDDDDFGKAPKDMLITEYSAMEQKAFEFSMGILISEKISALLDNAKKEFTVFAVVSKEFKGVPEGLSEEILKPENTEIMDTFLGYHIIEGKAYTEEELLEMDGKEIETITGAKLQVSVQKNPKYKKPTLRSEKDKKNDADKTSSTTKSAEDNDSKTSTTTPEASTTSTTTQEASTTSTTTQEASTTTTTSTQEASTTTTTSTQEGSTSTTTTAQESSKSSTTTLEASSISTTTIASQKIINSTTTAKSDTQLNNTSIPFDQLSGLTNLTNNSNILTAPAANNNINNNNVTITNSSDISNDTDTFSRRLVGEDNTTTSTSTTTKSTDDTMSSTTISSNDTISTTTISSNDTTSTTTIPSNDTISTTTKLSDEVTTTTIVAEEKDVFENVEKIIYINNERLYPKPTRAKNGMYYLVGGVLVHPALRNVYYEGVNAKQENRDPICRDDPQMETIGKVSCYDMASNYDCETTKIDYLTTKYGTTLPPNTPSWVRLSDVCPETCGTCIKGYKPAGYVRKPEKICRDDPRIEQQSDCGFIIERYGCDMKINDVLIDAGLPPDPTIPEVAIIEDACRLTCDACPKSFRKQGIPKTVNVLHGTRVCNDDPFLSAIGVSCDLLESSYTCDGLLSEMAIEYGQELPDMIPKTARVKDACRYTCNHCPPGWKLATPIEENVTGPSIYDIVMNYPGFERIRESANQNGEFEKLRGLTKATVILPHNYAFDIQNQVAVELLQNTLSSKKYKTVQDSIGKHAVISARGIKSKELDSLDPRGFMSSANQPLTFRFIPKGGYIYGDAVNDPSYPNYVYDYQADALNPEIHTPKTKAPYNGFARVGDYTNQKLDELELMIDELNYRLNGKTENIMRSPEALYRESLINQLENEPEFILNGEVINNELDYKRGELFIEEGKVLKEFYATNGVVYVVNAIITPDIFPRPPASKLIRDTPGFDKLESLLELSGLLDVSDQVGPLTLLIVQDSGLKIPSSDDLLPDCIFNALMKPEGHETVNKITKFSSLPGLWYTDDFEDGGEYMTMSGIPIETRRSNYWTGHNAQSKKHNNGYLYFINPHGNVYCGVIQGNIKFAKGVMHVLDCLPLHPDADLRIVAYWNCIDNGLRMHRWLLPFGLPLLDKGRNMPLLGQPPGVRPNWVASGLKKYYPPPLIWPIKEKKQFG